MNSRQAINRMRDISSMISSREMETIRNISEISSRMSSAIQALSPRRSLIERIMGADVAPGPDEIRRISGELAFDLMRYQFELRKRQKQNELLMSSLDEIGEVMRGDESPENSISLRVYENISLTARFIAQSDSALLEKVTRIIDDVIPIWDDVADTAEKSARGITSRGAMEAMTRHADNLLRMSRLSEQQSPPSPDDDAQTEQRGSPAP